MNRTEPNDHPRSGAIEMAGLPSGDAPDLAQKPSRVAIERMQPQIDCGRFPVKRTVGEAIFVSADVIGDGHDRLAGVLQYRHWHGDWREVPLMPLGNDSWGASFTLTQIGEYEYTMEAWIDQFGSWLASLSAKADAGQDVHNELIEGAEIVERAATVRLTPSPAKRASASLAGSVRPERTDEPALVGRVAKRPDNGGGGPDTAVVRDMTSR